MITPELLKEIGFELDEKHDGNLISYHHKSSPKSYEDGDVFCVGYNKEKDEYYFWLRSMSARLCTGKIEEIQDIKDLVRIFTKINL